MSGGTELGGPMPPRPERFGVGDMMLLILGAAFGVWIYRIMPNDKSFDVRSVGDWYFAILIATLGVSMAGPAIVFRGLRRSRTWSYGERIWFIDGIIGWLVSVPIAIVHARRTGLSFSNIGAVFSVALTFPIAALSVVIAVVGTRRPRPKGAPWKARVGLVLGIVNAVEGVIALGTIYYSAFFQ